MAGAGDASRNAGGRGATGAAELRVPVISRDLWGWSGEVPGSGCPTCVALVRLACDQLEGFVGPPNDDLSDGGLRPIRWPCSAGAEKNNSCTRSEASTFCWCLRGFVNVAAWRKSPGWQ